MQLVCVAACVERVSGVAVCVWCAVVGEGGAGLGGGGRWWCGERCDEVLVLKEDESRVRMQKKMQFVCVASWCRRVYDRSTMAEPAGCGCVCVV